MLTRSMKVKGVKFLTVTAVVLLNIVHPNFYTLHVSQQGVIPLP